MFALFTLLAAAPAPTPAELPACVIMAKDPASVAKRASKLDSLVFKVGAVDVKVCYGAPQLKGRRMIGGEAVPFGKLWRTGANEPTMLHTSGTLMIGQLVVPAGSYSIYSVPGEKTWEIIVNKSITQWGAEAGYTEAIKAQEIGRTTVKAETGPSTEVLTFTAAPSAKDAKALVLAWDRAKISIPVMAH
jgi:hypothetical protein